MYFFKLFFGAFLICAPIAGSAQERDRLDHRGEILGWEAVGRLDLGDGFCTGTLIAKDLVLTAAHCVYDAEKGQIKPVQQMVFRAGYAHGNAIANRRVSKVVIPPNYAPTPDTVTSAQSVAADLALLRLETAIFTSEADPFKIHETAPRGTKVMLVSYGRGRAESLTRESGCAVTQQYRDGIFGFDCDATFGSSGAPVFTREGGLIRILSVISSGGSNHSGEQRAFGMSLPKVVAGLKREMRNDAARAPVSAGAKRVIVGQRSGGGARFVKVD